MIGSWFESYELIAMAMLGFFGTAHCVGMCGPLVLVVPARHKGLAAHLLYHAGRIITYTGIGAAIAAIGGIVRSVGDDPLAGVVSVEVILSLVAATFLTIMGFSRMGFFREPAWMAKASPAKLPGFESVTKQASARGGLSVFLWGLMLGTLPCGLSYAAFAKALGAGGAVQGATMVFAFGLGTLPGLLLLGTVGGHFFSKHRRVFDLLSGALMVAMALSLVADGIASLG